MPAYLVAEMEVSDLKTYEQYRAQVPEVLAAYDGRFLVRGGTTEAKEGTPPATRVVIIEFPDMAAARRFYDGPDYQATILPLRLAASQGRLYLVEGASEPPFSVLQAI
jgi:uncharacterized protein (DUF1330 family)